MTNVAEIDDLIMTPRLSENERQADLMGRGTYRKVGRQEGHPDGGEIERKGGGVSVGAAGGEVDPSRLRAKVAPPKFLSHSKVEWFVPRTQIVNWRAVRGVSFMLLRG